MSVNSDDDRAEGIIGRKMVFCDRLQLFETDELIRVCPDCRCFVLYCCHCLNTRAEDGPPCHHFRLIFSDGACRSNGLVGATAGIGILYGEKTASQRAIPITSELDPGQKRTSQRAELLAALAAVRFMAEVDQLNRENRMGRDGGDRSGFENDVWVIATDSEYVVKGMTEWLPTWKVNLVSHSLPTKFSLFLMEADRGEIVEWPSYQPRYQACQSRSIPETRRGNHDSGEPTGFEDWLLAYLPRV